MTQATIRPARRSDIDQLVAMRSEFTFEDVEPSDAITRPDYEDDCRTFLEDAVKNDHWQIWVVEVQDQIVSHAFVALIDKVPRPVGENRRIAYLTNVFTRPDFRRRGLGAQLIRRAQEASREAAVELMIVWPGDESVEFYRREGFGKPDEPLIWCAD